MTSVKSANEKPTYPRNEEIMWTAPKDGRRHIDTELIAEARKRVASRLTANERATPEGPTAIIEHFAHEIEGKLVDPRRDNVTIYSQLFIVEEKEPDLSSRR